MSQQGQNINFNGPRSRLNERSLMPSFALVCAKDGEVFDSSDLKRKKNLVLFLLSHIDAGFLLKAEEAMEGIRNQNAELVIICPLPPDAALEFYKKHRLSFFILSDEKKDNFSRFLVFEKNDEVAALFVLDKFSDIFFQHVERRAADLPPFEDIVKSLSFIESQCPECEGGI